MKSLSIVVLFVVTFFSTTIFSQSDEINIIPKPMSLSLDGGSFLFDRTTKIFASDQEGLKLAGLLNEYLNTNFKFTLQIVNRKPAKNFIGFLSLSSAVSHSGKNGFYVLRVKSDSIQTEGIGAGRFYALQSLLQLLPVSSSQPIAVHSQTIIDEPRFAYRGMHLDVSRHYMPLEFVKKYIDLMSQYKFNTFHWHLTDDQGWRIEIKKYPKLAELGSKRSESHLGSYSTIFKGDGRPIEGFYTQEQIKDVIAYAKARFITVIPEIELPGHASAALAAYPQLGLGCAAKDYKFEVKKTWGIFKEVFCPTDETFKFLEDVLDETIKLFPDSPYIHIGGDEVLKDYWKESAFVQELKKRENLKDEHEVQSYFVRRIEKFINSRGKKIIGWDEILEGGVAPNATIMSWRGEKGGIEAAKAKHDVIMTPNTYVYFDYGQGDPANEPLNIGGYLPLEKVYSFDPVPKELSTDEAKYIIGGQANIWTEYLKTPAAVEYMAFPRILALSESLWSSAANKNYDNFRSRLSEHFQRLDKQNVNYRIPEPGGLQNIVTENERVAITLTPAPATRVFYTTDGSTPDEKSLAYSQPIDIALNDGETKTLKTIVVNSTGRKSSVYTASIVRGKYREAESTTATTTGVTYELVIPNENPDYKNATYKGETQSILLTQFEKKIDLNKSFGVQFDGYLKIPTDGIYEFQVDSTWDTTIVLGDKMIINDVGTAASKRRSAVVPLKAGLHKISLRYNHRGGAAHFRFRYGIKGQGLRGGEFVH